MPDMWDDASWRDEETLRTLHAEGLTPPQIADRLNCSPATIRNWMDEYGLERDTQTPGGKADRVGCRACGGEATARHVVWGSTGARCFKCEACGAGGHTTKDGRVRHGPVFEGERPRPEGGPLEVVADD